MQMSYTQIKYRLPKIYPHRLNYFLYSYNNKTLNKCGAHVHIQIHVQRNL